MGDIYREMAINARKLLASVKEDESHPIVEDNNEEIASIAVGIDMIFSTSLPVEAKQTVLRAFCDVLFVLGWRARSNQLEIPDAFRED